MHGILGNKRNWQTPAKAFVRAMPDFVAVNIDHRGHGASVVERDSGTTLHDCALDLRALFTDKGFLQDTGLAGSHHAHHNPHDVHDKASKHGKAAASTLPVAPTVLCGHSFGGKVALAYLKHCVELGCPLPAVTFILDAMPGLYPVQKDSKSAQQSVFELLNILQQAPPVFANKKAALDHLSAQGIESSLVHWLAINLVPVEGEAEAVRFGFDIGFIEGLFQSYCATDMWDFLFEFNRRTHSQEAALKHHSHHLGHAVQGVDSKHPDARPSKIVFVRAGRNKAWSDATLQRFAELQKGASSPQAQAHAGHAHEQHNHGNVQLVTMPQVGHWLHVDDMQGLVDLLVKHTKENL